MSLRSCLYEGAVRHRRHAPIEHEFSNRLFMLYLDLDELPTLFSGRWLWSSQGPNVAWFRREDHLGPRTEPLERSVRNLIEASTGVRPSGPIRLLTHLRYFGYVINPISLYYCFDEDDELEFVVAEVTNTPWGDRHCYVLDVRDQPRRVLRTYAAKALHVSPFFAMNYRYKFTLTRPSRSVTFGVANMNGDGSGGRPIFDAVTSLRRRELTGGEMARALRRRPLMTMQVAVGIYWQAFRLWKRGVPYVPPPQCGTGQMATAHGMLEHNSTSRSTETFQETSR